MAPSPRKLVTIPPRATTSRSTRVWKSFRTSSTCVHSVRFAERGEAGQVDEDDRGILMDRLDEKFRILGQPCAKRRGLELLQQVALHGEVLRLPAVQPKLHRAEQDCRRSRSRDRQRRAEPDAMRKRHEIRDRPDREHGQDRERARAALRRHASKPTSSSVRSDRQRRRRCRVSSGHERSRRRSSTGNGCGDNLHARASADRTASENTSPPPVTVHPDHDDPISNGLRATSPLNTEAALMVRIVPWRAIERQRQDMVDIHRDIPSRQLRLSASKVGSAAGCQRGGAQRKRQVDLVAGSKQHRDAARRA